MRLIHLTDPHLSTLEGQTFLGLRGKRRSGYLSWFKNRRFIHRPEILERLIQAVESQHPDLILLTGDLVHIGLESEIVQAAQWLRRLGPPERVMLVPGNHDNYAADSLAAMRAHWGEYLPAGEAPGGDYTSGYPVVRKAGGIRFVGVNSSSVTRIFSAAGELGEAQRQRLAQVLEQASNRDDFDCFLIHHPPLPGMTRRRKALRDAVQLEDLLGRRPPDLALYGHIHVNREHVFDSSRMYCTASASSEKNASFRVFDLDRTDSGWQCRMRLLSLVEGPGMDASFSQREESSWRLPAAADPAKTGP